MELNHHDESSEEIDHSENMDRGLISRWYECVFCKRGFNTAQALGGHMNIHRKERTRNNKPSSNTHKRQTHNNLSGSRLYPQVQVSYAGPSLHGNNYYHHHQECFSDDRQPSDPLIPGGDWRVRVSLGFDPTVMEDLERNRQVIDQKEELDLELRLGCNS